MIAAERHIGLGAVEVGGGLAVGGENAEIGRQSDLGQEAAVGCVDLADRSGRAVFDGDELRAVARHRQLGRIGDGQERVEGLSVGKIVEHDPLATGAVGQVAVVGRYGEARPVHRVTRAVGDEGELVEVDRKVGNAQALGQGAQVDHLAEVGFVAAHESQLLVAAQAHGGRLGSGGDDGSHAEVGQIDDIGLIARIAGHDGVLVAGCQRYRLLAEGNIGYDRLGVPVEYCQIVGGAVSGQHPFAVAGKGYLAEVIAFRLVAGCQRLQFEARLVGDLWENGGVAAIRFERERIALSLVEGDLGRRSGK